MCCSCADDGVMEIGGGRSNECPEQGPVLVMTKQPQHDHCIMYPDFTFWDWEGRLQGKAQHRVVLAGSIVRCWAWDHPRSHPARSWGDTSFGFPPYQNGPNLATDDRHGHSCPLHFDWHVLRFVKAECEGRGPIIQI